MLPISYDTSQNPKLHVLEDYHYHWINRIEWSLDDRNIITSSQDNTVSVFDVASKKRQSIFRLATLAKLIPLAARNFQIPHL